MLGCIIEAGEGVLELRVEECCVCHHPHQTLLTILDQKLVVAGHHFFYFTRCPSTRRVILLRKAIGNSLEACIIDDPTTLPKKQ